MDSTPRLSEIDRGLDASALFASLDDGSRLLTLPFVRDVLGAEHAQLAAEEAARLIRQRVHATIERLDDRSRAIVVRCDLGRETHRSVAADLGIGERHFYRLRHAALVRFSELFGQKAEHRDAATTIRPLDGLLGILAALSNSGRTGDGRALLTQAHAQEGSAELRAELALRLAQLEAGDGRRDEATKWIHQSRQALGESGATLTPALLMTCELDLVEIAVMTSDERGQQPEQRLRSVARRLTALGSHRESGRVATTLGSTYLDQAGLHIAKGAYSEALTFALDAQATFRRMLLPAPASEVRALIAIAHARCFTTGSLAGAQDDLSEAFSRAAAFGLGKEIALLAATLALICAARGERARALGYLRSGITMGPYVSGDDRVAWIIDLSSAALRLGDVKSAQVIRRSVGPGGGGLSGGYGVYNYVLEINGARCHLAGNEPHEALRVTRRAKMSIERIGGMRFLGSALTAEAEALGALGQRAEAKKRIGEALDCLAADGHPLAQSRAHAVAAQLTGNRRHRSMAREMLA